MGWAEAEKDIPRILQGPGERQWSLVLAFDAERGGQILGVFSRQSHSIYSGGRGRARLAPCF